MREEMNLIDNKKGIAYHMILWIPKMLYFILVFTAVFGFIFLFTKSESYIGAVEARTIIHRIHFYPDGVFSKYDQTINRHYLGVKEDFGNEPDLDKHLEKTLFLNKRNLPLKIGVFKPDDQNPDLIFRDRGLYDPWVPLAHILEEEEDIKGKGRVFVYRDYRTLSDRTILKTNIFIQDE